jgi:hypothetical protein
MLARPGSEMTAFLEVAMGTATKRAWLGLRAHQAFLVER